MSQWSAILTTEQLDALHALTVSLDPMFAARSREFWCSRTAAQLQTLAFQAWKNSDSSQWQQARSWLRVRFPDEVVPAH